MHALQALHDALHALHAAHAPRTTAGLSLKPHRVQGKLSTVMYSVQLRNVVPCMTPCHVILSLSLSFSFPENELSVIAASPP